jgi:hypothetical protein
MTKTRPPPQGWKEWYLDKGRPVNRGQDRVEIQNRFSSSKKKKKKKTGNEGQKKKKF